MWLAKNISFLPLYPSLNCHTPNMLHASVCRCSIAVATSSAVLRSSSEWTRDFLSAWFTIRPTDVLLSSRFHYTTPLSISTSEAEIHVFERLDNHAIAAVILRISGLRAFSPFATVRWLTGDSARRGGRNILAHTQLTHTFSGFKSGAGSK